MAKLTLTKIVDEMWDLFEKQVENVGLKPADIEWAVKFIPNQLLKIGQGMLGLWNNKAKGGWATIGPRMLGPTFEKGTITKIGKRTFLAPAPMGSKTAIVLQKLDGKAGAEVEILVHGRNGRIVQRTKMHFPEDKSTPKKHVVVGNGKFGIVSVEIDAKMPALRLDKFAYQIKYVERPVMDDEKPVTGFADLHVHQVAEYAYLGNWLHGSHAGSPSTALRPCSAAEHAMPQTIWDGLLMTAPNASKVRHGKGHPTYEDWPHHLDMAHQQVHESWLQAAHKRGLNLIIACPVNNEPFSLIMGALHPREAKGAFRDMPVIKEQIGRIHAFAKGHKWYQVAHNPWEAREIIHAGKLAVVISVECSNLFPRDQGYYIEQLDDLYGMGVRCLQIVHEVDSRFAGAALQEKMLSVLQTVKRATKLDLGFGFKKDDSGRNAIGLTDDGEKLLNALMDRHMLVDTSHYSARALQDAFGIALRRQGYPLINSHTKFNSVLTPEEQAVQREFVTTDAQTRVYKETGGIVGLRTAPWPNRQVPRGGKPVAVRTDTGEIGTARSYAQQVTYAADHGVPMAIGSDINGFTNQLGPRNTDGSKPANVSQEYWKQGLRHIGLLPDLVQDLIALKTPGAQELASSAETFLRCWERTWIRMGSDGTTRKSTKRTATPVARKTPPKPAAARRTATRVNANRKRATRTVRKFGQT